MGYPNDPDMFIMIAKRRKSPSLGFEKLEQSVHCFEPVWDSIWDTNGTQIGTLLKILKPLRYCFYYIFGIVRSTSPAPETFFLHYPA